MQSGTSASRPKQRWAVQLDRQEPRLFLALLKAVLGPVVLVGSLLAPLERRGTLAGGSRSGTRGPQSGHHDVGLEREVRHSRKRIPRAGGRGCRRVETLPARV